MTENLRAVGLQYCFCDSLPLSRVSIFFYILESLCLYDHHPTVQNERNALRVFHRVLEPVAHRSRHSLLRSRLPTHLSQEMEWRCCQVAVTISYSALLCAGEALATLLLATLVTSRFLAQDLVGPLETHKPKMKGDPAESQAKLKDAEGDDGNDEDDDNDGDGGFGEGEDVSSEDDGGNFGKNTNGNKSNSKKGPGGGAGGAEENGEGEGEGEDDDEEEDGEDQEDDEDEDEDEEDDGDEEVEEDEEEEEDEDEEALQPPKKRKK